MTIMKTQTSATIGGVKFLQTFFCQKSYNKFLIGQAFSKLSREHLPWFFFYGLCPMLCSVFPIRARGRYFPNAALALGPPHDSKIRLSSYSVIVRVRVALKRTVVGD